MLANVAASWGDLLGDQLLQDFPLPNPVSMTVLQEILEANVLELILPTFLI